jgi:hypothetical protein
MIFSFDFDPCKTSGLNKVLGSSNTVSTFNEPLESLESKDLTLEHISSCVLSQHVSLGVGEGAEWGMK